MGEKRKADVAPVVETPKPKKIKLIITNKGVSSRMPSPSSQKSGSFSTAGAPPTMSRVMQKFAPKPSQESASK